MRASETTTHRTNSGEFGPVGLLDDQVSQSTLIGRLDDWPLFVNYTLSIRRDSVASSRLLAVAITIINIIIGLATTNIATARGKLVM